MPGILPRYAVNEKEIDKEGDNERMERSKMIERAWNYYAGKHDAPLDDAETKQIILNMERQAVDRVTDMIGVPALHTAQEGDDGIEQVLQMLADISEIEELVPDVITAGQVEGHSFLRIIPPVDGVISAANPPMLGHLPAKYVTVYWDLGLFGMQQASLWYRLQWDDGREKRRQDIVPGVLMPDELRQGIGIEEWAIIEYEYVNRGNGGWVEVARDRWPYPFPPIIDGKNARKPHSYYGQSEIEDTRLQDALNFVATNTAKIIKAHAHPMGFAKGFQPPQETKIGGVYYIPDPEGDFKLVEMQGDLQSSMRFMEVIRQAFFSEARVTDPSVVKDKIGAATNFTMRMMYSDMIDQVEDKQKRYGKMLTEAFRRMMYMVGYDVEIMAEWPDPLPVNKLELVQRLQVEDALGVTSKQMMAEDLGRDYETVVQQKQEEAATDIDRQVGLLTGLAERGVMNGGF